MNKTITLDKQELEKLQNLNNEVTDELITELKKTGEECDKLREENKKLLETNQHLRKDIINTVIEPEPKPKEKHKTWKDFLDEQSKVKQIWR